MEFIIWIVFWIIHVIVMGVIHTLFGVFAVSDPLWMYGLTSYGQLGAIILCIFIFRKYLCSTKELPLFSKKNLKYYICAVVIGIGVCLGHRIFFMLFMDSVIQSLQDIGETIIMDQVMFLDTVPGILYEALLEPFAEELIVRGIIFHVARQRIGNLYAVIVSSILFALGHPNGVQFITALFMGMIIGYAIILTDNVYIGVVIHVVNNSFSAFNANVLNKFWGQSYHQIFIQVSVGCILLVLGILMLRREAGKGLFWNRNDC